MVPSPLDITRVTSDGIVRVSPESTVILLAIVHVLTPSHVAPNVELHVVSSMVPPKAKEGSKDCEIDTSPTRKTVTISRAENFIVIEITPRKYNYCKVVKYDLPIFG